MLSTDSSCLIFELNFVKINCLKTRVLNKATSVGSNEHLGLSVFHIQGII